MSQLYVPLVAAIVTPPLPQTINTATTNDQKSSFSQFLVSVRNAITIESIEKKQIYIFTLEAIAGRDWPNFDFVFASFCY